MKKSTRQWLAKAEEDIKCAEILLSHEERLGNSIGFHCQQVVEKSLKGFLEEKDIKFPRTHDLAELIDLCAKNDSEFSKLSEELKILEPFAVDARYPEDENFIDETSEVSNLYEIAERVFKMVSEKLEGK